MAIETIIGDAITLIDADPPTKMLGSSNGGRVKTWIDHWAIAAGTAADDGSTYRVARMPKNAVILEARVLVDAADAPADLDFGYIDGTAAQKKALAEAVSLNGAAGWYSVLNDELADPDQCGLQLWERLGFTDEADCPQEVDLGLEVDGTAQGGNAIINCAIMIYYAVP
jgi:hypothetical protein